MERYYNTLGLAPPRGGGELPTIEKVRTAYKQQALKYHPDRAEGSTEEAQQRMKEINEAYDEIKKYNPPAGDHRRGGNTNVWQKQYTSVTIKNNQKITRKTVQKVINGVVVEQHEQVYITTL